MQCAALERRSLEPSGFMNHFAPYITLETVRIGLEVSSRKRLFEEAASLFEVAYGVAHDEVFDALNARERIGSTCVGSGCGLPHGRLAGITEPALVFLRTSEPLALDAPDGRPVSLFFCLLVPEEGDQSAYLALLKELAEMLLDREARKGLLAAPDEISVCRLLHEWRSKSTQADAPKAASSDDAPDESPQP